MQFDQLRKQSLFLVWGPPSHGPRSRVFARELGIEELHYVFSVTSRGLLSAPLRYAYQAAHTLLLLFRKRPRLVFVQSPPSIAVLFVFLYCALSGGRYVIDAHSAAFLHPVWRFPAWLHAFLARRAITTIVTNEHFQQQISRRGGHALVVRDIPTSFGGGRAPRDGFNVVMVNTFSADEPLREVVEAAAGLPEVQFFVTGNKRRASRELLAAATANVQFTDFLPDDAYYALLSSCQAIICLTTRDHTMQRGACEALSIGTPIITSNWPILRRYFHKGAVHVDNSAKGIGQGVRQMQACHEQYQAEIVALQAEQQQEWQQNVAALAGLIEQSFTSAHLRQRVSN